MRYNTRHRPLTGARIETTSGTPTVTNWKIAPSRGRGLKHCDDVVSFDVFNRPLTGARIETSRWQQDQQRPRIAPSRGRGLKPYSPVAVKPID